MPGRYMTPERFHKEFVCLAEQVEGGKKEKICSVPVAAVPTHTTASKMEWEKIGTPLR